MARQISLREFQQSLAQRLREAQATDEQSSRLGVQAGERYWLLKLDETDEVLSVPEISPVPLTRPWYLGLANIRGVMANVVDFGAFLGGEATPRTPDCRLLLVADRFQSYSGLLISRMMGLRNLQNLEALGAPNAPNAPNAQPWSGVVYRDPEGRPWNELDMAALVGDESFLNVGA
jgi:twitching motility protein PilI